MSIENQQKSIPRSIRHRQILDVAEGNPSASVAEIAAQVPSATPDLVEQVFEEHGDPAADGDSEPESEESMAPSTESADGESGAESDPTPETDSETGGTDEQATDEEAVDDAKDETDEIDGESNETDTEGEYSSLDVPSAKHRALLEAVAARPAATQADLAEELEVTKATISRWASEIPGFEWRERDSFVAAVADDGHELDMTHSTADTDSDADTNTGSDTDSDTNTDTTETAQTTAATDDAAATVAVSELKAELSDLAERVSALEAVGDSAEESAAHESGFEDPELVHKIAHACLESERISEAEELRILKRLLN